MLGNTFRLPGRSTDRSLHARYPLSLSAASRHGFFWAQKPPLRRITPGRPRSNDILLCVRPEIRPAGKAVLETVSSVTQGVKKESHNILLLTWEKSLNSESFIFNAIISIAYDGFRDAAFATRRKS
jgi:hypothetical protein